MQTAAIMTFSGAWGRGQPMLSRDCWRMSCCSDMSDERRQALGVREVAVFSFIQGKANRRMRQLHLESKHSGNMRRDPAEKTWWTWKPPEACAHTRCLPFHWAWKSMSRRWSSIYTAVRHTAASQTARCYHGSSYHTQNRPKSRTVRVWWCKYLRLCKALLAGMRIDRRPCSH